MASSSPHDALPTDRYRPDSLAPVWTPKRTCPLDTKRGKTLPVLLLPLTLIRLFSSAKRTGLSVIYLTPHSKRETSSVKNSRFSCKESRKPPSFFFLSLKSQPKRVPHLTHTLTKTHPRNACHCYAHGKEKESNLASRKRRESPKESRKPSRILSCEQQSEPHGLLSSVGCSVCSAHGAQTEVTPRYPQVSAADTDIHTRVKHRQRNPVFLSTNRC